MNYIMNLIWCLLPLNIQKALTRNVYLNNSNSQAGEDRILSFLFESMGITTISYIDIGANHPINSNNTYLFYEKGSRGVVIEPDPDLYETLKNERPDDIIIQAAVNKKGSGKMDFFIFDNSQLNTLSKQEAQLREKIGSFKIIDTISIDLYTIEDIICKYFTDKLPDLISLDVEGVDHEILKSFDFDTYPVPIFIVETCAYSENHIKGKLTEIIDLMKMKGYFVYADTYINTIFINDEWFVEYSK